ncbi:MAG: hypothetical protein KIS78_08460 [Labilithrix sp.]|nr:hypothetical protein [Labilithrix sp.]MCW5832456.1 hypothetical protein [Labilithrix sp.]
MATYQQIDGGNGCGCGPASLMVAAHERNHGATPLTAAEEIQVHTQCAFRDAAAVGAPVYDPDEYSSPVRLADYAVNTYGFASARVVLSGQLFRRMLLRRYPNELALATTMGVPVDYWLGWSPRYLYTRNWVLMVVLCVDHTSMLFPRTGGALLGGGGALLRGAATLSGVGIGAAIGAAALEAATSLFDLARGLGVTGHPNLSLHTVLYRGGTYMDPATGQDYWFLNRMGGDDRAYWDTGCYVLLS